MFQVNILRREESRIISYSLGLNPLLGMEPRLVNLVLVEVETVKVGKWTSRHVLKWRKQNGKLIGVGIIKKKVVQVLIRRVRNHSLVVKQLSRKGKLKW